MATTKKPLNKRKQASKKPIEKKVSSARKPTRKATQKTDETAEKKKMFLEVAKANLGFISATCKAIGIAPNTFYKWMADDPEFKAAYDEVYDDRREFVESSLYKQIKAGNTTATIFALKAKFGWEDHQKIDVKADTNISILSFDPLKKD